MREIRPVVVFAAEPELPEPTEALVSTHRTVLHGCLVTFAVVGDAVLHRVSLPFAS